MKDATLAQGNEILKLILQKGTPASQLQELIESGLFSDLLDANTNQIDRTEFRKFLGLKPVIIVWFESHTFFEGHDGYHRARLRDEKEIDASRKYFDDAVKSLLRTLKNLNRPHKDADYVIITRKDFEHPDRKE